MTPEDLFELVKRVDPRAVRLPPSIIKIVAAIEAATIERFSTQIIERALHHELYALEKLCNAASQKAFRLPSGREVTRGELDRAFALRDECRDTLNVIRAIAKKEGA